MALNLIRKTNNPAVSAYQDTTLFHQALGEDVLNQKKGLIFQGVYNSFSPIVNQLAKTFALKTGMGALYGLQFELADNETFEFDFSSLTGNNYIVIYIEIKITADAETIELKSSYSNVAYPTLASDNLFTSKLGTATMELYRIRYDADFVSEPIRSYSATFYSKAPGTSETARNLPGTALINGRSVSDIFVPNEDAVYKAHYATKCGYAPRLGTSESAATIINNDLSTGNGTYLLQATILTIRPTIPGQVDGGDQTFNISAPKGTVVAILLSGSISGVVLGVNSFNGTIYEQSQTVYLGNFGFYPNSTTGLAEFIFTKGTPGGTSTIRVISGNIFDNFKIALISIGG